MKLKSAEQDTLSAGEIALDVLALYDRGIVPNDAFSIPIVVKIGQKYLRVSGSNIKTRKDGSKVMILNIKES